TPRPQGAQPLGVAGLQPQSGAYPMGMMVVGGVLLLIQAVAALPWLALAFMTRDQRKELYRNPLARPVLQRVGTGVVVLVIAPVVFGLFVQSRDGLEASGRLYGAVLQLQLLIDFFVLGFALLLLVWPKGGAVALASFREGIRQSMFWLLTVLALAAMAV